jgi:flagellar protein FliO/FliZ
MMWVELFKTAGVLIGVIGLIFLFAYAMKRLGLARNSGDGGTEGWRLLGTKSLGPKRQVVLLEVGTKIVVVGISDKSIATLSEITDAKDREVLLNATKKPERSIPNFRDILRKAQS